MSVSRGYVRNAELFKGRHRQSITAGTGMRKTAAIVGVGTGTARRIKLEMTTEANLNLA
jgi:hypothetical protein